MEQMIDLSRARRIAAEAIKEGLETSDGITPVILDDQTLECDFGWVFFLESQEYIATQDFSHRLVGNAPIIIDRHDGTVHITGTAKPIEFYISEYIRQRSQRLRKT